MLQNAGGSSENGVIILLIIITIEPSTSTKGKQSETGIFMNFIVGLCVRK